MAFYSYKSSNYDYDRGYDYAPAPSEASSQYLSPYEYGEPELLEYKSSAYYYSSVATPESNYSVYTSPEPQILQYDPTEYRYSHNYSEYYSVNPSDYSYGEPKHLRYEPPPHETKFLISYSKVEFNEPEFEEYDPTPYGGGYDPVSTYGKPLPPSETTCYPRSVPRTDPISSESFSYASIPSPYGKDDDNGDIPKKPSNVAKPIDAKTDTETCVENGDKVVVSDGVDVETVGDGSMPEGYENGVEKVTGGDYYGGESERQMHYIPYGSGLETIDICESIFGYWPCLAKIEQQQQQQKRSKEEERRMDPWKSAADYLFGGPEPVVVYDYDNYHHHHQQQAEYEYHSWLQ